MQLPDVKEGETIIFTLAPAKEIKQLLSFLKVKVVVKKLGPGVGKREILVYGAGAEGLKTALVSLASGAQAEHGIPRADCSQQLWICGDYSLRLVSWAEDLIEELARGRHPLCVIDGGHRVALRSGAEECIRQARTRNPTLNHPKTHYKPEELLSELVRISPASRYVFSCHMKGQGIPREDRAQYEKCPAVVKVMGRTDSPANQKYLSELIRKLYR